MSTRSISTRIRTARSHGILRETLLTTGAVLGALCILSAVVAPLLGMKLLVFQSGSMSPSIHTGAAAITRTVDADELHQGDIVSVTTSTGTRVTHRITGITHQGDQTVLQLKGDANNSADSERYPVTKVDRVVAHVNGLGYVVNAMATPYAVFVAGGVAAGLLVLAFRHRGTPESATSDELAEEDSTEVTDDAAVPERSGRHRRAAVTAGVVIAALGVGTAAWSGIRGSSVVPTLAAFSDAATVNGSAAALTVPSPTGALTCSNGAPFSGTVVLNWTDVAEASSAYQYRVDVYLNDPSKPEKTYLISEPTVTIGQGDLPSGSGTYNVRLSTSLDGTSWQSSSTIQRSMWSTNAWTDINCG